MDALRPRLSFEQDHLAERLHPVLVAGVVLLALVVALLLVREIRFAPHAFATTAVAGASSDVVSVATLVLDADRQIRVGDSKSDTIARVGSQTLITRTDEAGPFGRREVRAYAGFTLVFEPLARAGESRVAAIYVQ